MCPKATLCSRDCGECRIQLGVLQEVQCAFTFIVIRTLRLSIIHLSSLLIVGVGAWLIAGGDMYPHIHARFMVVLCPSFGTIENAAATSFVLFFPVGSTPKLPS